MAATITFASSRITISGPHRTVTADGSCTTTTVGGTGAEAPFVSDDVGRLLVFCRGGTANTGPWETRRIVSVSSGRATVHSPFSAAPLSGAILRVSTSLSDILTAQPTAGTKRGAATFHFNGDFSLTSDAVLASFNESAEWARSYPNPSMLMAAGTVLQCGIAWGVEGSATETTDGSRWHLADSTDNPVSIYTMNNARVADGPVVNFYGSLIESSSGSTANSSYLFQRMNGPARFIGCTFDGIVGGRFYHEASEWVSCRMSGNNNNTPAWSIGATFTRDISDIFFFRNVMAMKSFIAFGGTLRDIFFAASNDSVFDRSANDADSVFNFIDSTEISIDQITAGAGGTNGGDINQFRSINLITTDGDGAALPGVAVRVNNSSDVSQGSVLNSDGSGVVAEILALRFFLAHQSNTMVAYAPFRTRLRKYGFYFLGLASPIADPISQSTALIVDPNVTQSEAAAAAHTGISVVQHGSPVAWNGLNWSITVTGNRTTNPSLTAEDIKHYLHYHLARTAAFSGKGSGLEWHNLFPMVGTVTERGNYGGTQRGVRVVDENGDPFSGVTRMQSDSGVNYTPPPQVEFSLTGLVDNTEVRIYRASDDVELFGVENSSGGTVTYPYSFLEATPVYVHIHHIEYVPIRLEPTLGSEDVAVPIQQRFDRNYSNPT